MKHLLLLIIILLSIFNSNDLFSQYSGGTGTSGDPYQLATTADLITLSNNSSHWSSHFKLTQNIEFNADETLVDWDGDGSANWDTEDQLGLNPIGNNATYFTGVFDGQNYSISNLFINRQTQNNIAMFGNVNASGDKIKNLVLFGVNITGKENVGALIGFNQGTISNCNSSGTVSSKSHTAGGLIGDNWGSISNSNSSCTVNAIGNNAGGFAGFNSSSGAINNSYSTGNVSGDANTASGFVGGNTGTINNSYATGSVTCSGDIVGGLVGFNFGIISNSFSTGSVIGSSIVGGLVGIYVDGSISNSYSIGSVSGSSNTGGFIGSYLSGSLTSNYWKTDGGSIEDTGDDGDIAGITETSDPNMKIQGTFSGWDFGTDETDWVMSSNISFFGYPTLRWTGGYAVAPTGSPKEIATLPNLVWIAENSSRWADSYIQTANISTWTIPSWDGNKGWKPIGNFTTKFTGLYDGDGYTVSNIYIKRTAQDEIGFFGYIDGSGDKIKNLGMININITGRFSVGGMVGKNYSGTIYNCYSIGNVSGNQRVGGFIGENNFGTINECFSMSYVNGITSVGGFIGKNIFGTITECYSESYVNCTSYSGGFIGGNFSGNISKCFSVGRINGLFIIGGFVGVNVPEHDIGNSFIVNCYSLSNVYRTSGSYSDIGGFCGVNSTGLDYDDGIIRNCYSTGSVNFGTSKGFIGQNSGIASNNFFDSQTSGQTSGVGATAKTTSVMKSISTFTDLSTSGLTSPWDFLGTPHDDAATSDIWRIIPTENDGYPIHNWNTPTDKASTIYVDENNNDEVEGWLYSYFNNLTDGLDNATTDATVNISNYTHTGDVDMTGRTFIIGAQDFVLDGELTGGVIRAISTGYLSLTPTQNTQITFPVTDGTNNETIKITCLNNPSQNIKVRIKNDQSITGGLTDPMDIIDIRGENNMNATIVFRIDKAQIAPKTIRTNTVLRWYNGTNYVLFPQENVSITEFDTYYEITVTGINQFSHE